MVLLLIAWVAGADAGAASGVVRTTAGATVTGTVRFETNGLTVLPEAGDPVHVPFEQLIEWRASGTTNPPAAAVPSGDDAPAVANAPRPAEWTGVQLGPGMAGQITATEDQVLVAGSGQGLRGTLDGLFFAHRRLETSGQVMALLEQFDGSHPESTAGLLLRDNLGESAAYAFLGVRRAAGLCFQYRQIASGMTLLTTNIPMKLPAWIRLVRAGGSVVADVSSDGRAWTTVGRANANIGQSARAGLAVASGKDDALATAVFRSALVGARGLGYAATTGYPKVLLRGGSTLIVPVESDDDSVVRLGGSLAGGLVSTLNLARIEYVPLAPELVARIEASRPGVLLADGDFIEGAFRGLATNTVTISSLLFGFRRFTAGSEAAWIQFGEAAPEEGGFRVELRNGSELRARVLEAGPEPESLRASSPLLGTLVVKAETIAAIRRGPGER